MYVCVWHSQRIFSKLEKAWIDVINSLPGRNNDEHLQIKIIKLTLTELLFVSVSNHYANVKNFKNITINPEKSLQLYW